MCSRKSNSTEMHNNRDFKPDRLLSYYNDHSLTLMSL